MTISVGQTKSWVSKFGLVRLVGIGGFLLICLLLISIDDVKRFLLASMIMNLIFANQQIQIHCLIFLVTTISNIDEPQVTIA